MTVFKLKWRKKLGKSKWKKVDQSKQIETKCPNTLRKKIDRHWIIL
jgi:hypothetical protein